MDRDLRAKANAAIEQVAEVFFVNPNDIVSDCRKSEVMDARKATYLILRDHFRLGYKDIARVTRKTDHGTIISGVKSARDLCSTEPAYRYLYDTALDRVRCNPPDIENVKLIVNMPA